MKKILIIIIVMIGYFQSKAQNVLTTPLTWSVTELNDLNTNKIASYMCSFKTSGTTEILWVQKNNYTRKLEVQQTTGTWMDVSAEGQVVYSISEDSDTGTLTFERTSSGIYITLDLSQGTQPRLRQKYSVVQVN
jgi:hypothetical protein